MTRTRRVQILMERAEYERLEEIAARRRVSVGSLVCEAVRERYLVGEEARRQSLERIFGLELPVGEWGVWKDVEEEIAGGHDAGLPLGSP